MSIEFQAVLRELDQIGRRIDTAIARLEERDESRDTEVSDLKLQVGLLRGECKRNIKRDATLVMAPTTLTAIITAVLNATAAPAPAAVPAQPIARCGDAIVQPTERCDDGVNDGGPGRCLPGCLGWGRVAP